mgnify:CR=1 FL=1
MMALMSKIMQDWKSAFIGSAIYIKVLGYIVRIQEWFYNK